MKNSGIKWIGEIPDDWEVIKTKNVFRNVKRIVGEQHWDCERLALTLNGVIKRNKDEADGLQPEKFDTYQFLYKNELVFKLIDLGNIATSRVGLSPFDGMVSPAYIILYNDCSDNRFYYYYYLSMWHRNIFNSLGDNGVRSSIGANDLLNLPIVDTNEAERIKIADFLDKKCAEIDRLITHEEAMIDELKAYKQSVITEAVTKGLDRSVPMKDSGVEWIGEIPEHWHIMPLKSKFNFGKGLSITKADLVSEGVKVISYGQIHAKYNKSHCIDKSLYRFVDGQYLQICPSALVRQGDFIFADTSEDVEGSGDFVYIDNSDLIFAGYHCITLKNINLHDGKYLAFLFMSQNWKNQIQSQVNGVKLFSITKRYLADAKLLLPPQNEQQQIADYLDKKCAEIDRLISLKQEKIEELRNYKKSLIYEYVTGKKEVCE